MAMATVMIMIRKRNSFLPLKIDIHNHILPGVDDGFKSAGDSLNVLKKLSMAGCKSVCFTPHINPEIYNANSEENLRSIYKDFIVNIPLEWGISTHLAGEYMVFDGFEKRVEDDLLCYEDGSVLIEMSYFYRSDNLENVLFGLSMAGKTPILAHPERYLYMADSLRDFDKFRDMGCRFQINLLSLSGCYGKSSIHILSYLRKNNFCDFFATDLHSAQQLESIFSLRRSRVWADLRG